MALLDKNHINTLIAVGTQDKDGKFVCDSTSFMIGFLVEDNGHELKNLYSTFLVTNRHVFENREKVWLRINTDDGKNKTFEQNLFSEKKESMWLAHDDVNVDLALLKISPSLLKSHNIQPTFISEENFAYIKNFQEIGISPGDENFVIGFPMGLAGEEKNYPYIKMGIISRIDEEILKSKKSFVIDSSIFPGNSGGPVILKPTILSLDGTKAVQKPYLLGVVSAYIPYQDILYTHQTIPPTPITITRENSGLSYCVPMDFVKEIYDRWLKEQKPIEETKQVK